MFLSTVLLLAGLVALVMGADLLVKGASTIAARARVPPMVVGLTIVSFGTSMPEFLVTLISGVQHNADLAVANVMAPSSSPCTARTWCTPFVEADAR